MMKASYGILPRSIRSSAFLYAVLKGIRWENIPLAAPELGKACERQGLVAIHVMISLKDIDFIIIRYY